MKRLAILLLILSAAPVFAAAPVCPDEDRMCGSEPVCAEAGIRLCEDWSDASTAENCNGNPDHYWSMSGGGNCRTCPGETNDVLNEMCRMGVGFVGNGFEFGIMGSPCPGPPGCGGAAGRCCACCEAGFIDTAFGVDHVDVKQPHYIRWITKASSGYEFRTQSSGQKHFFGHKITTASGQDLASTPGIFLGAEVSGASPSRGVFYFDGQCKASRAGGGAHCWQADYRGGRYFDGASTIPNSAVGADAARCTIDSGRWYQVEMAAKCASTSTASDGWRRLWINGFLCVDLQGLGPGRIAPNGDIYDNCWSASTLVGAGSDGGWAGNFEATYIRFAAEYGGDYDFPHPEQKIAYDNIVVRDRYIGGPLSSPTGLIATTAITGNVTLQWADQATGETGYAVERRTLPSGSFGVLDETLAANATTYADATAVSGSYEYRVRTRAGTGGASYSWWANLPVSIVTLSTRGVQRRGVRLAQIVD